MTLMGLKQLLEERNQEIASGSRNTWTDNERVQVQQFLGDLVHDVELVRELLERPTFVGMPRVLRDEYFEFPGRGGDPVAQQAAVPNRERGANWRASTFSDGHGASARLCACRF